MKLPWKKKKPSLYYLYIYEEVGGIWRWVLYDHGRWVAAGTGDSVRDSFHKAVKRAKPNKIVSAVVRRQHEY